MNQLREDTKWSLHLTTKSMLGEISEDVTTTEFYTDPPYLMASTRIYCTRVSSIERVEIGCSSVIGLRKGLCKSLGYDIEDIFGKGRGL